MGKVWKNGTLLKYIEGPKKGEEISRKKGKAKRREKKENVTKRRDEEDLPR